MIRGLSPSRPVPSSIQHWGLDRTWQSNVPRAILGPSEPGRKLGGVGMSRSLVRVIAIATAACLAFVAWMLIPALFMAIPWGIRWWFGMTAFLALLAGLTAFALRYSPPRPWRLVDPATTPQQGLHRAWAWGLQAVALSFAYAFFARPGYGAVTDWDLHLAWFEALRLAVVRYHQFPWWDPWCCGGFPLAFEPQVGLASLDTLFVLPFGTEDGLKLASIASMMLATEGARRLARIVVADPWAVALAAAIYAWNGAVLIFTISGHALTLCYPFFPWMLLFALRLNRGVGPAVGLGISAAASVLAIVQYPTAYGALLTAGVVAWGFLGRPRADRTRYLLLVGVAASVFLALAGWRLVLTGMILRDFPRRLSSLVDNPLYNMAHALVDREVPPPRVRSYTKGFNSEQACYVGALALFAAVVSLRRGWRWWHTIAAVGFSMALGMVTIWHPSYWTSSWPGFSTMHMVGRWRLVAVLGLALAAADELGTWRRSGGRLRLLAALLATASVADLAVYAHQCLPISFSTPPSERKGPEPPVATIVSLQYWDFQGDPSGYEAVRRGYAVIGGYCPLLGYDRARSTARLWRGHPAYRGEFVADGHAIEPTSWSPNRVVLNRLKPDQEVEVNQNPSNYWLANGRHLFPHARCAEVRDRFLARADANGRLVLEIAPPGVNAAIGTSVIGLILTGLLIPLALRLRRLDSNP